jgi:hypothetical protein
MTRGLGIATALPECTIRAMMKPMSVLKPNFDYLRGARNGWNR